jgi:exodeoxyribonuclease VII large subunit
VGHEVDVTIADLVADHRAATPSAAAERVVLDGAELLRHLRVATLRLNAGIRRLTDERRRAVDGLAAALAARTTALLDRRANRLGRLADKLEALSPLAALKRGFAVAQDEHGRVLRRVEDFPRGGRFRLRVTDGRVDCRTEGTESHG